MRLQKYLAMHGVGSRRKCEEYIRHGRVKVNGEAVTKMGFTINPDVDRVEFDGRLVQDEDVKKVYIMLNKPKNYISTVKDNFDRKTVLDLIDVKERIYPVGRLDYDSEGLLILTNDGNLTYALTHPKHRIPKTYICKIKGKPTDCEIKKFEGGLVIDGYLTSKAKFKVLKEYRENSLVQITIWEGRNRQIRKMCDKIGHPVITLKRTKIGEISLGNLGLGEYRFLTDDEVRVLKKNCGID